MPRRESTENQLSLRKSDFGSIAQGIHTNAFACFPCMSLIFSPCFREKYTPRILAMIALDPSALAMVIVLGYLACAGVDGWVGGQVLCFVKKKRMTVLRFHSSLALSWFYIHRQAVLVWICFCQGRYSSQIFDANSIIMIRNELLTLCCLFRSSTNCFLVANRFGERMACRLSHAPSSPMSRTTHVIIVGDQVLLCEGGLDWNFIDYVFRRIPLLQRRTLSPTITLLLTLATSASPAL